MFCPKCGAQAMDGAEFCPKCGAKVVSDSKPQPIPIPSPGTGVPAQLHPQQQAGIPVAPVRVQPQQYVGPAAPLKKKSKAPIIILSIIGGIFSLFVLLIIIGIVFGSDDTSNSQSSQVTPTAENFSESYTNEKNGIFFKYPSGWKPVKEEDYDDYVNASDGETLAVFLNETEDLPENTTCILLQKYPATPEDETFISISEQEFLEENKDEAFTVKEAPVVQLDGVPCRKLTAVDSNGNGYMIYSYINGSFFYQLEFSWVGETPGNNQLFFDAIMDSYTIAPLSAEAAEPSNTDTSSTTSSSVVPDNGETAVAEENKDMVLFRGTPVFDLVDVSHEVIYDLLGDPDTSMYGGEELTYGNVLLHFDMFSLDEPFLNGILSTNADDFTYNGQPIPDTYDGLTGLFGDSPKEDDHGRYCYTWRYGGRWVDLTVAPKDSSIDPGTISMSWRPQSFEEEQPVVGPALPYGFEWVEAPYVTDDGLFQNIEGVIRNNSGAQLSYASVSFNLYDANGNQIGNTSDIIWDWGSGNTWKFSASLSSEAAKYQFVELDYH